MLIEGIEEVFFNLDFSHVPEEKYNSILELGGVLPKGIGNSLRATFQSYNGGLICGTVLDSKSRKYDATLGNEYYMFYGECFGMMIK